jgi:phage major head subunit gpT-like protein
MFVAGYESIQALSQMFANRVVSSERTISYRGLGAAPRMREWLDEIQGAVFNTKVPFPVTVRDWEASVEIPVSELQADRLGEYGMKMQQMGAFAKQHPDELIAALIVAAETTLCYDGQNMCDTDHAEGDSGTQSNLLTTGGDDDDIADIVIDLGTAIAAFQRFKDDRGRALRIGSAPDAVYDVLCRPEVLPVFTQLATAEQITGTTSQWKGRIRPTGIPELTAADEWYILWTGGPVKPLIVQYQNEPSALKILGPDSEHATKTGRAFFTTQGNYTVAPGDWRCIIKIKKS